MQDEHGSALRVATGLPVDEVAVADVHHAGFIWFDRRKALHGILLIV
jgi:hypothetical protein